MLILYCNYSLIGEEIEASLLITLASSRCLHRVNSLLDSTQFLRQRYEILANKLNCWLGGRFVEQEMLSLS